MLARSERNAKIHQTYGLVATRARAEGFEWVNHLIALSESGKNITHLTRRVKFCLGDHHIAKLA